MDDLQRNRGCPKGERGAVTHQVGKRDVARAQDDDRLVNTGTACGLERGGVVDRPQIAGGQFVMGVGEIMRRRLACGARQLDMIRTGTEVVHSAYRQHQRREVRGNRRLANIRIVLHAVRRVPVNLGLEGVLNL